MTRVVVTQKEIDEAVRSDSGKCMASDGMRASIPGCTRPITDLQTMRYTDAQGVRRTYLTPVSVQAALARFDDGVEVKPFAFNLSHPIHISRPTHGTRAGETRRAKVDRQAGIPAPARVGGQPIPASRMQRRFGMRNLRINQAGEAEQTGLIE